MNHPLKPLWPILFALMIPARTLSKHLAASLLVARNNTRSISSYVTSTARLRPSLQLQWSRHARRTPWQPCRPYNTGLLRKTVQLPEKVEIELTGRGEDRSDPNPPAAKALAASPNLSDIKQRVGSTYGGTYTLNWVQPPHSVLIVKKPNDVNTEAALIEIAKWLHENYPQLNIVIEPEVAEHFKDKLPFVYVIPENSISEYARIIDFVITLGGDGTILHVSSLFPKAAPPVISFSLGTLGFLMPFHIHHFTHALQDVIRGGVSLLLRMRLNCSLRRPDGMKIMQDDVEIDDYNVMNEVTLHRGRFPHLTAIDCFVDGQYLTDAVADGLIVATPTGSTAYSLSAGGPIIHPSVQSLVMTPICPRSLSFRTVLLPTSASIQLRIGETSRSPVEVCMDGREVYMLEKGEYLQVRMSWYPMPCVNRVDEGVDWVRDINELLKWNQNFESKSLLRHGYADVA